MRMKNKTMAYKQKVLILCLILLAAGTLIGFFFSLRDWKKINSVRRNVSIKINFAYDGVARNKLPNGEPFTVDGIKNNEVIEGALQNLGLSDKYDIELIRESMRIKGSYPNDVMERLSDYESVYDYNGLGNVNKDQYYATEYTITLYDDFKEGISAEDLKEILKAITDEYEQYFRNSYVYKYNDDSKNRSDFMNEVDYRQQIEVLKNRIEMVEDYSLFLYMADSNFSYNNLNFNDIGVRCEDIKNNNLSGLEAKVMMKVYSKSPERLQNMYQYRINLLDDQVKRAEENLKEMENLIDNYEMDDILYVGMGGEAVVAIESNSTETYEALVTRKIDLTNKITGLNSDILKYKGYLSDLSNEKATSAETAIVEKEINDIVNKIYSVEMTLREMLDAFNEYKLGEEDILIGNVRYNSPSIFSFAFIKKMIKFSIPVYLIMFAFFGINMMVNQIKIFKRKNIETETM
jgi:hypothetical protein